MARVTVGIPVYNGAPMLRECLDSLLAQSYQDFIIVIADNASTDETPDICAEYAARDSRIQIIRRPQNIGVLPNYKDLVDRTTTEFYMWRADDDYSDENFIEHLITVLDKNPQAQLAIPRIITRNSPENYFGEFAFPVTTGPDAATRITKRLYLYHASSYYGLWRTPYIQETSSRIWSTFSEAYACDHLTLLAPFLDEVAVPANETLFIQRTYSPVKGDGLRGKISLDFRIARLERLMPLFYACFDAEVKRRGFPKDQERRILRERKRFTYAKLRASPIRIMRLKGKQWLEKLFGVFYTG